MMGISFLYPWLLAALVILPWLWWLLRATPPSPSTIAFPAFFLLRLLKTQEKTPARTPWWLLLLRVLCAALFIVVFAHPVMKQAEILPPGKGDWAIIVDNGWAAASHWPARQERAQDLLADAARDGRTVTLAMTAPDENGKAAVYGPADAASARNWLAAQKPYPWPTDPATLKPVLEKESPARTIYLSDGVTEILFNPDVIISDDGINKPYILRQDTVERLSTDAPEIVRLLALSEDGGVLDMKDVSFLPKERETKIKWEMPSDMRRKLARIEIEGANQTSSAYLMDRAGSGKTFVVTGEADPDVLSESYYPSRALPDAEVTTDINAALQNGAATLILPDSAVVDAEIRAALKDWVEKGGLLIRFAGARMAANAEDDLLPVGLRGGARATEGAMTWEKPLHLGAISKDSPLQGLAVQNDVTVTRQVLASPSPETFSRTWLSLEDGTPLVTGTAVGQGAIVLVHTTTGPAWSDFCYSGLYVEMLQRLSSLGKNVTGYRGRDDAPPLLLMDAFSRLSSPDAATNIPPIGAGVSFSPSPRQPPGLYGDAAGAKAFNLGDTLSPLWRAKIPSGALIEPYVQADTRDFQAPLILIALFLLMLDALAVLRLRGFALLFVALLASTPVQATEDHGLYLAYIETGDAETDRLSHNGLTRLGEVINIRTSARVQGAKGINPERETLSFYPLVYWPLTGKSFGLSLTALKNVQDYIAHGGIVFFDTRDARFDGEGPGTRTLRALTRELQLPELTLMPKDHILTRSFYLLDQTPGRFANGGLWVEKEPDARHDGVVSVVIGSNDWAAAWSVDEEDRARYAIEPGGELQREMAYRFGVNLAMVALTGNYKSDQVHVPFILERIGK